MEESKYFKVSHRLVEVILIVLITGAVFYAVQPEGHNYEGKAKLSEIVTLIPQAQNEIEKYLLQGKPLSELDFSKFPTQGQYVSYIKYFTSGEILAYEASEGSFVLYYPELIDHKQVVWHCEGQPYKNMPRTCKGAYNQGQQNDLR